MGQVTVTIADKIYRIACDDGQEAHLMALAWASLETRSARSVLPVAPSPTNWEIAGVLASNTTHS
jgi:hypothetical protein